MTRKRAERLGAALEQLYAAALDSERWPAALEALRNLFDVSDEPAATAADDDLVADALLTALQRIAAQIGAARPGPETAATLAGERAEAIIIVDESLRLLFANQAARHLLAGDDWLRIDGDCLTGINATLLRNLVGSLIGAVEFADLQRTSTVLPRGDLPPLRVRALPLQPQSAPPGIAGAGPRRVAMLMLADPAQDAARDRERLRRLFGLTSAEAEFALEIVKGDGRQAAAERRGIAASTARTHLSNIFEKTGTRRQAELVRLLLQLGVATRHD